MFHRGAGMKRIVTKAVAIAALSIPAAGCDDKAGAGTTSALDVRPTSGPALSAFPVASVAMPASAEPTFRVEPPAEPAEPAEPADPDAKTFDCGAKGQKLCPMQKWMKTVMAGASSSGDGAKLAEALTYVANHPPPGYATWAAISIDGAKKARADDIDGAKASCKQCHDQFKSKYKATLRDRPF
jgi:hypothetical protein